MKNIIDRDNLRNFAYVNDNVCKKPVRGIALSFIGLGDGSMYDGDSEAGRYYGERGILFVIPYSNPWSWMNRQTVAFVDEIVDVLQAEYGQGKELPVVSSGGSMGGQSALVYCAYAKRTPVACVANCPVCDAVFHYAERPDLPRTFYSALGGENGDLEGALKSVSPLHLIDKMPAIDYCVFHCGNDQAVSITGHSDPFVAKMREAGRKVEYIVVPDRGHCDLGDKKLLYLQHIAGAIE